MFDELHFLIEKIIKAIQAQEFEQIENLDSLLESKDFLNFIEKIDIKEAELLYCKIQTAVDIINTQKVLLLDELTLLQNGKKALSFYNV